MCVHYAIRGENPFCAGDCHGPSAHEQLRTRFVSPNRFTQWVHNAWKQSSILFFVTRDIGRETVDEDAVFIAKTNTMQEEHRLSIT